YLYVGDAADALVKLLLSDVTGPINIGSGNPVVVRSLIEMIARQLGRADGIEWGRPLTADQQVPLIPADVDKTRRELSWGAQVDLPSGIAQTIAWWQTQVNRK